MKHIARSAVVRAAVVVTLLAFGAVASAQGPNKCLAGKNKCASKKMQSLLKCHNAAEKLGMAVDPACITKAENKFDGGTAPAKGCFAKNEAKNDGPCLTTVDTTPIENKIDAFVLDVVQELDPGYPTVVTNECSAGKKKCVLKKAAALLKCHEKAVKAGVATDPVCLQKAKDKFDGGADPTKSCFEKLEAAPGCPTNNDTAALEAKVDAFVKDVLCELGYTTLNCGPPPTPTPTATATPVPGFNGALGPPTTGRFNYNMTLGLPGVSAACNSNFPFSHACTYSELQSAQIAGSLAGAMDTSAMTVTSFWAIDSGQPPLQQCNDDALGGSGLNWEYATAHTASRGQRVALNNPLGTLGPLQSGVQCNIAGTSWVGCCQ